MNLIMRTFGIWFITAGFGTAQETPFRNLGFESARLPVIPISQEGGLVSASDALRGWTVYPAPERWAGIYHNATTFGSATIKVFGPNWRNSSDILTGNYSILLGGALVFPPGSATAVPSVPGIGQIGTIPSDSRSVRFETDGSSSFTLTFAGTELPIFYVETKPRYQIWGADVGMLAGQTGELRFVGSGILDEIAFSSLAVPEPGVLSLLLGGFGLFRWLVWRRRESR
jgi:hypothetical protein